MPSPDPIIPLSSAGVTASVTDLESSLRALVKYIGGTAYTNGVSGSVGPQLTLDGFSNGAIDNSMKREPFSRFSVSVPIYLLNTGKIIKMNIPGIDIMARRTEVYALGADISIADIPVGGSQADVEFKVAAGAWLDQAITLETNTPQSFAFTGAPILVQPGVVDPELSIEVVSFPVDDGPAYGLNMTFHFKAKHIQ